MFSVAEISPTKLHYLLLTHMKMKFYTKKKALLVYAQALTNMFNNAFMLFLL